MANVKDTIAELERRADMLAEEAKVCAKSNPERAEAYRKAATRYQLQAGDLLPYLESEAE